MKYAYSSRQSLHTTGETPSAHFSDQSPTLQRRAASGEQQQQPRALRSDMYWRSFLALPQAGICADSFLLNVEEDLQRRTAGGEQQQQPRATQSDVSAAFAFYGMHTWTSNFRCYLCRSGCRVVRLAAFF